MKAERAPGYLDAIAGVPLSSATLAAWQSAATQAWSDPARMHHAGRASGLLLDSARASIANFLGVSPANVFFAGSGPDALRATISGIFAVRSGISPRILVGSVESMAVLGAANSLPGAKVVPLALDRAANMGAITGAIDLTHLQSQLSLGAAMACVQVANAEVGTRQPFAEALTACRTAGVPLVADATAVITHDQLPTDFDVLVAPAKDWGGPPGVAIVVTSPQLRWRPEEAPDRGWIGGFPDIPAAVAAAVALEEAAPSWQIQAESNRAMIDRVRSELLSMNLTCAGDPTARLPHVLTFCIEGAAGGALVTELDKRGIQVASGSACTADTRMPSHVLEAMGMPNDSSIRISLPPDCSDATIDLFLAQLPEALAVVTA
jgi:cysteine desulfurase